MLSRSAVIVTCALCFIASAADSPSLVISLDKVMSKDEQEKTGVSKLSSKERTALEQWLTRFTIAVATEAPRHSADAGAADLTIPRDRNPNLTPSVNPKFTPSINPDFTPSINPAFTPSLNPDFTPSINPDFTPSLNPQFTPSINPNFTPSINPDFTPSLDPTKSRWTGFYVFDVDAGFIGVAVKVKTNERVMLFFNGKGKWVGYFVSNDSRGFNWFDLKGEWIGYAVFNCKDSFNLFDKKGKWRAYLT